MFGNIYLRVLLLHSFLFQLSISKGSLSISQVPRGNLFMNSNWEWFLVLNIENRSKFKVLFVSEKIHSCCRRESPTSGFLHDPVGNVCRGEQHVGGQLRNCVSRTL